MKNDHIYLVVNAGCRDKDLAHIEEHMKASKAKGGDVCGTFMMRDLFLLCVAIEGVLSVCLREKWV